MQILEPEFYVDLNGEIRKGCIVIDGENIIALSDQPAGSVSHRLKNQVIVPGFVNAHSHIFQRALRGIAEKNSGRQDNFWTWRQKMYGLLSSMNADDFLTIAKLAYVEMLEAGFTQVGEFHYLHHDEDADPLAMSRAVQQAAEFAGISLNLLLTAYHQHNFSEAIKPEQQRFFYGQAAEFLDFWAAVNQAVGPKGVQVGLAIHSVRAVPHEWFLSLGDFAKAHKLSLHIHASEQQAEVQAAMAATGCSPIELLDKNQLLTKATTLIHATHLIKDDVARIAQAQASVCVCPSTEKNLGDGVIELATLLHSGVSICLGTDQHVRFDPFDEARSLEEQERLRLMARCLTYGPNEELYLPLLRSLTQAGLISLDPQRHHHTLLNQKANLVALELPPEYVWHGPKAALNAMMLSYHPGKITHVISKGSFVVQDGRSLCSEKPHLIKEIGEFFKKSSWRA